VSIVSKMLQTFGALETKPRKVKLEGTFVSLYVDPLYGESLKIIFITVFFYFTKNLLRFTTFATKAFRQRV